MNDKETYGIELELITTKFNNKIKDLKNKIIDFSNNFNIGLEYSDEDELKMLNGIAKLKSEIKELNETKTKELMPIAQVQEIKNQIEQRKQLINEMVERVNSLTNSTVKLGQAVARIKNNIKSGTIINSLKENMKEVGTTIGGLKDKFFGIFGKSKNDSKGIGGTITSAFDRGIKSIKRFSVALLGVRGIYGLLTKSVRSYLADHENVANQMNAMISGIGNLLAPAIEYVLNIVSKLLSYVNAFIKMLTGVDLFAKGMESINKSAKKTAKSVNDIKGGLAGIDEITNIATDTNNGDNSPKGDVSLLPKVDMAPLEKLKDFLSKIFEPFTKAWDKTKTSFIKSAKDMVSKVGGMFKSIGGSILEVWTNGTGQKTIEYIITLFEKIFDIVGNIGEAIKVAWDYEGNGTQIIQAIADIFNDILGFVNEIGDSISKWTASEGFQTALKRIFTFIKDIFNYAKDIANWVLSMYKKYLKPVIDDALLPAIDSIITAIGDIWNVVKPVVDKVVEVARGVIEPIIANVSKAIKGIITAVKGVAEFISGVFTLDWQKAWTGVKDIFGGIWDTMMNIIKVPINFIISGVELLINGIIDAFNSAKKVLNIIGIDVGQTNHVYIRRLGEAPIIEGAGGIAGGLPRLASGTNYVESEGLAYLHQGEAVVPEKFNDRKYFGNDEETKDLLRQLIDVVEDKDFDVNIDGEAIGKTAKNYINNQSRLLGRSVV